MRRRKYGYDVYFVGGFIILVNVAVIVAKFMGKDVGIAIPDALASIQRQSEWIAAAYVFLRVQAQTNKAHQRVNKLKDDSKKDEKIISEAGILP